MGYKSYSKKKRDKFDYRSNYLKHNPGLLGTWYICYNCGKILTKKTVQVDHIVPLDSKFGFNRLFNCSSLCEHCNKVKSNKLEKSYILKGYSFKCLEELTILIQNLFSLGVKGGVFFNDSSAVQKCVVGFFILLLLCKMF